MPSQPSRRQLPLLNLYELADGSGGSRHVVAFVEPVRAGSEGISARSVVGDFRPGPSGGFDPGTFRPNPEFLAALSAYMDHEAGRSASLIEQAAAIRSGWLYVDDPRAVASESGAEAPDPGDLLGAFAVDDAGQIVPGSFQYNSRHALFDPDRGPSGIFRDRRFHDWLHGGAAA